MSCDNVGPDRQQIRSQFVVTGLGRIGWLFKRAARYSPRQARLRLLPRRRVRCWTLKKSCALFACGQKARDRLFGMLQRRSSKQSPNCCNKAAVLGYKRVSAEVEC
jgi:hypothetical protein